MGLKLSGRNMNSEGFDHRGYPGIVGVLSPVRAYLSKLRKDLQA